MNIGKILAHLGQFVGQLNNKWHYHFMWSPYLYNIKSWNWESSHVRAQFFKTSKTSQRKIKLTSE